MLKWKSIIYYFLIPIALYLLISFGIYFFFSIHKPKELIETSLSIVSSLAIIIGGFWTYNKFGWEKKCENIIKLKAALLLYRDTHSLAAGEFRQSKQTKDDLIQYKLSITRSYNELIKSVHLSYYVDKKLRGKIFKTIFIPVSMKLETLDESFINFGAGIKEIFEEFEKILDI